MIRTSRARAACLGLLLALTGGCGLTAYEDLAVQTQDREERFRESNQYLDAPINVPTRKDKDSEVSLADVFFRPPKGISATAEAKPRGDLMYRYSARQSAGDFALVEMAFGSGNKGFAGNVLRNFQTSDQGTRKSTRQVRSPDRPTPLTFEVHEFDDAQYSYSVNIWQGSHTQVAIVFFLIKGRRDTDAARKVINLSLESFAADAAAAPARQAYNKKSPWRLKAGPAR